MHHFSNFVEVNQEWTISIRFFEMGQSVPENKPLDPKSLLPGHTVVTNAVKDFGHKYRQYFSSELRKRSLQYDGAIKTDVLHLKVQGKHFYDFTLHFKDVSVNGLFQEPNFQIRNIILLIVEGSGSLKDQNIKSCSNNILIRTIS